MDTQNDENSSVASPEHRYLVSVLAGSGGMSERELARGFGLSQEAFRERFSFELTVGALQRRAEVIEEMHRRALAGDSKAAKAYMTMVPKQTAQSLRRERVARTRAAKKPEGKKARQMAEAVVAQRGTEWADLLDSPAQ